MSHSQTPLRIPETMTPSEIGVYMSGLREHFKLSLQDVSDKLHIRVRYVLAMEQGALEQLPGKAYARGYVHTYAEFLGIDADQVVALCFPGEVAAPLTPASLPKSMPTRQQIATNWRGLGIAGVVAIAVMLAFTQLTGGEKEIPVLAPSVAPVPEALLESVRNAVMPTPRNIDCLTDDLVLSCFYANATTQDMMGLERTDRIPFAGDLDLANAMKTVTPDTSAPAPDAEKKTDDTTDE